MSAGFGWSISDVVLLAKTARTVHNALKKEGGAAEDFQDARFSLNTLQLILEHVQKVLAKADPSFRNALGAQLEMSIGSVSDFNVRLQAKYGEKLGEVNPLYTTAPWNIARHVGPFQRHKSFRVFSRSYTSK
jgi:hypothetical protein